MEKAGITMGKFIAGVIIAILVSSAVSVAISTQLLVAGPQGSQGATGPTGATGTQGPPGPQGPYLPDYDSGWVDISDKAGQSLVLTHDLGSTDVIVDVTGKLTQAGEQHQFHLGLSDYTYGFDAPYGGPLNEEACSVIQTSWGGYAIVGWSDSFSASADVYLVKTDRWGKMQWNKTYGGAGLDWGYSLVQTSDDGYVIAGFTDSFGAGLQDVYLVKTDRWGKMQWNRTYGGASTDVGYSLVLASDGGYVIAGSTWSFGNGLDDVYLVKTDAAGNMQWNKTYGGESYDSGYSVARTSDGGYIIVGGSMSFDFGDRDVYLVKTDAGGNMQWNRTYGMTEYDVGFSVVQTLDEGYAIAGSAGPFGVPSDDVYLVKTDSSGTMQWNKTYGGAGDDVGFSLVQTSDGGYVIAGNTDSFGAGFRDVYLVRTDSAGTMLWMKTYGGARFDSGRCVIQTADGGYAIAGVTYGPGGLRDAYLVKAALESGLAWIATSNTITLYRGTADIYWNYVRVRVWKID